MLQPAYRARATKLEAGPGFERELFHGARIFVLPNPSGRNLSFPGVADKLPWYRALASLA